MSTTPADLIDSAVSIPSAPTVLVELERLFADTESDTRDVAGVIEHDPAIAARVLRLANSPFYGLPGVLTSISSACTTLGRRVLRNTVLQASVINAFSGSDGDDIWDHSFKVAIATQLLITKSQLATGISRDDAYTCGLMHDIGKLLLMQAMPERYGEVAAARDAQGVDTITAETSVLGFTHVDAGMALATEWSLPDEIQNAIQHHHGSGSIEPEAIGGRFVQFGDDITHAIQAGSVENNDALKAHCRQFQIDLEDLEEIVEAVAETKIPS